MKRTLAALFSLLVTACASPGLQPLVFEGHELHPSLAPLSLEAMPLHIPHALLRENPQWSEEPAFVRAVARGGSQGRLDSRGMRAALYGVYRGESDIGLYVLEAESVEVARRREKLLRDIWQVNVSFERARVHRGGKVLIVAWNAPSTPACWEEVNAALVERLGKR